MKRVCKQTFDIALFTAPAVRALERFTLYVSVIIYFILYVICTQYYDICLQREYIEVYMACILYVCVCVLICCTHSHTLICLCIKIEISAAIKTNL